MTGKHPEHEIDHAGGDPSNNRWVNLREATRGQNSQNRSRHRNNTSGYPGVTLCRSPALRTPRWEASVSVNGKRLNLGCFGDPDIVYIWRLVAEIKHFGDFRRAA